MFFPTEILKHQFGTVRLSPEMKEKICQRFYDTRQSYSDRQRFDAESLSTAMFV